MQIYEVHVPSKESCEINSHVGQRLLTYNHAGWFGVNPNKPGLWVGYGFAGWVSQYRGTRFRVGMAY